MKQEQKIWIKGNSKQGKEIIGKNIDHYAETGEESIHFISVSGLEITIVLYHPSKSK